MFIHLLGGSLAALCGSVKIDRTHMSNESDKPGSATKRRPYRKRRRAESEEQTRRRITEAAVELHGTIGPARTTVKAVADLAGVQRATVYRHFPDEFALFGACSAHWASQHPLPDLEAWTAIADPAERLRTALEELYGYYLAGEQMLENVTRDAPLVEALQPSVEPFMAWLATATDALVRGRPERGRARDRVRAAIGHALAFGTWRSLARGQGLEQADAVRLMTELVDAAGRR